MVCVVVGVTFFFEGGVIMRWRVYVISAQYPEERRPVGLRGGIELLEVGEVGSELSGETLMGVVEHYRWKSWLKRIEIEPVTG